MRSRFFRTYLLPGFLFQSVVVAGGYGTGREMVEFFLSHGPVGGLLALTLSTVIWSAVAAVSFELARTFRAFDYRSFFRKLLGPAWVTFELAYILLVLLVAAVIAAAAGVIVEETFGLPRLVGVLGVVLSVGYLLFRGSDTIEKALAVWSLVLYAVFLVLFVWSFQRFGGQIVAAFTAGHDRDGWIFGGLSYAGYNLTVVPVILFVVRHLESRKQAVGAGLLAGPIAILPGLLFFIALAGQYPEVLDRAVPVNMLLELLGSRAFQIVFQVVLFGTLIETGTGMIHAVNQRIAVTFEERGVPLPPIARPLSAVVFLGGAAALAPLGLIELIARGYGTLTWVFLAVFVLPVLAWGPWMIRGARREGG